MALKYVDLFAGCGGLSLGLEQAGFELELAVEKSAMAAETFYHNFINRIENPTAYEAFSDLSTRVEHQAERKLVVKELSAVLACPNLLRQLRDKDLDLVAGGPPCQGFSLAGKRNPDDVRNQLPWQFLQFVEFVVPKAVVIENVSGMNQDFKKEGRESPFDQLRIALAETGPGYEVQPVLLNAMHFGVPQHRPRVMLLALRNDIARATGFYGNAQIWKSDYERIGNVMFSHRPAIVPEATHFGDDILTVADAISDLNSKGYRRLSNISAFAEEMRTDDSWLPASRRGSYITSRIQNHTLRKHTEDTTTRFRLYQYFRDENVPSKVMGIPKAENVPEAGRRKLLADALQGVRFPATAPDGTILATNLHTLIEEIMWLGTKKHSQRPLVWNLPSPTIVSLPDDFVHPSEPRTLTVREMARFQSFPDAFEFRSKETTGSLRRRFEVPQYTQVGNAVPPKMAKAVGAALSDVLREATKRTQYKKAI